MLLKTFHKTKNFFHKTLQNLKSYALERYQKLPRPRFLNPFSSSSNPPNVQQLESFYTNASENWEPNGDVGTQRNKKSTMSAKEPTRKEKASNGHNMNYAEHHVTKNAKEEKGWEESKLGSHREVKRGDSRSQSGHKRGGPVLAKKMKELEMMDVHDMDHVLDIEEVLHLYSRLTSPVYLDLVDKFFVDMHSDFLPQPSTSVNSSMRRLGPVSRGDFHESSRSFRFGTTMCGP